MEFQMNSAHSNTQITTVTCGLTAQKQISTDAPQHQRSRS